MPLPERLLWPPRNFAAIDEEWSSYAASRFVVLPAPYDSTTTWRGGTREGPAAIIDASLNMELYDPELQREVYRAGIHTARELEPDLDGPAAMARRVGEVVAAVLADGKTPILLGGEHSLTPGAVQAASAHLRGEPLTVVQLDAHTDLREEYCGTRHGHGSMARHLLSLPGVQLVQAGLRSTSAEEASAVPERVTQYWCEDLLHDFDGFLGALEERLTANLYLTFDVDVCDPSWVPSTGTPEPGGLSYYQVRDILRTVCRGHHVVGMDCVEMTGESPAAAFAIARLLYKVMGYLSQ